MDDGIDKWTETVWVCIHKNTQTYISITIFLQEIYTYTHVCLSNILATNQLYHHPGHTYKDLSNLFKTVYMRNMCIYLYGYMCGTWAFVSWIPHSSRQGLTETKHSADRITGRKGFTRVVAKGSSASLQYYHSGGLNSMSLQIIIEKAEYASTHTHIYTIYIYILM